MKNFITVSLAALLVVALVFSLGVTKTEQNTHDAWLGVQMQTVTDELAKGFDLPVSYGAIVNGVIEDSPAEEVGLEEGDIIVAVDGRKVRDSDDLIDMIEDHSPQDEVILTIFREGAQKKIAVTLEGAPKSGRDVVVFNDGKSGRYLAVPAAPSAPSAPNAPEAPEAPRISGHWLDKNGQNYVIRMERGGFIGVGIMDLNDQLGAYFGVKDGEGALVTSVEDDSPAAKAGIKAGDVIVKIDGQQIDGTVDVSDAIRDKEKGDKVDIVVMRDKKEQSFKVAVGERKSHGYSYHYNGPDMNIQIPDMKGIWYGAYIDSLDAYFKSDEWKDQMRELKESIRELKQNVKEHELEQKQELKKQLDELREQLKKLSDRMK